MRTIGKYEVVEKIGDGGFGTVYKGFDPGIRRFVAIKSCTSEEPEVRSRFFHEAQIAGNLQHRNIVTVYDFGVQDEVPYLVQEYLSGEDLDRKIKRKDDIPLADKLLFLIQVARGLDYAHSRGVTHRDIKPANIRILEDGTTKIMDFGIAKIADQETGLTQTGMTLGTAAYLAPEQIRGEAVGPTSDIFSWGITAWELFSYRRPFTGQHISTVLYQILNEPAPPLREAAPQVPSEIVAIVERCLEKRPERRFPSCAEMLRELERATTARGMFRHSGVSPQATPPPRPRPDAHTRPLPTGATPSPARPSPSGSVQRLTASGAQRAPARSQLDTEGVTAQQPASDIAGELGEMELDALTHHTPHSISATQSLRSRNFPWGLWAAGVMLVVALAGGGWWLAQHNQHGGRGGARIVSREAAAVAASTTLAADKREIPTGVGASSDSGPGSGPAPAPSAAPAVPQPSAPPTPAPTPPPPKPSYVVVPAAWSKDIAVTLGKQRHTLGSEQRFEVKPGTVTLRFQLDAGEYHKTVSRSVKVTEGATVRVAAPIEAPGEIQVQPRIGSPPGSVSLDGKALAGNIVHATVDPGTHQLHVTPAAPGAQALDHEVEVPSGKKVIVTFDLAAGTVTPVVRPAG